MTKDRIILDARVTRQMSVGMIAYVQELTRRLPTAAPDLEFVALSNADIEPTPGLRIIPIAQNISVNGSLGEQLGLASKLRRLRSGRSLIHLMSVYAPRLTPVPYVYTIHDLIHLRFPEYFKWRVRPYYALVAAPVARGAAAVLTDTAATIADLSQYLGVRPAAARVVPLGVSERFMLDDARRSIRADQARQRFGLDKPYVLYAGNHRHHKNLETLAAAWQRVDLPCDLVLTEDYPFSFDLDRYGKSSGRIVRAGHVSEKELVDLYAGCAVTVQPSLYEGFGLSVLEGMAAGAPVIVAQTPALLEVAGDAAWTFPAQDAAALQALIQRALQGGDDVRRLVQLGRERAGAYSWDESARCTAAVYRECLGA